MKSLSVRKPFSPGLTIATSNVILELRDVIEDLAWFRYTLRKFLRFSENAARESGVTPQQHQLLLGVAGHTGRGWATLSELAEFLQEKHNSVVGLVRRAEKCGLVRKTQGGDDRRFVAVSLTRHGEAVLLKLTQLHKDEVLRVQQGILNLPKIKPPAKTKRSAPPTHAVAKKKSSTVKVIKKKIGRGSHD